MYKTLRAFHYRLIMHIRMVDGTLRHWERRILNKASDPVWVANIVFTFLGLVGLTDTDVYVSFTKYEVSRTFNVGQVYLMVTSL